MVQIDVNEQLFQKIGSEIECQMFVVFHAYVYFYVELRSIPQWVDELMIEVSWKFFCSNFDYNDTKSCGNLFCSHFDYNSCIIQLS